MVTRFGMFGFLFAVASLALLSPFGEAFAIAHNKVMVIDGQTVVTGSFNFTKAAEEKNAENLLVIKDQALARLYLENWERHRGHSEEYSGETSISKSK